MVQQSTSSKGDVLKTLAIVAAVGLASATVLAEMPDTGRQFGIPRSDATVVRPIAKRVEQPRDFGSGASVSTFNVHAFQPIDSSFDFRTDLHAVWPTSLGTSFGSIFVANVQLPEGAVIDYVKLDTCNNNETPAPLVFGLTHGGDIVDVTTSIVNGCGETSSALMGYQNESNAGRDFSFFITWMDGPVDGSVRFSRGEIWWHRSVSPSPLTPTFLDVPASDPGFQFIEALSASGVTAGCGGGNFCPDSTLTRRQIAIFLAKSLGLYWPN